MAAEKNFFVIQNETIETLHTMLQRSYRCKRIFSRCDS